MNRANPRRTGCEQILIRVAEMMSSMLDTGVSV
jgi:hypothetical protein